MEDMICEVVQDFNSAKVQAGCTPNTMTKILHPKC